MKSITYKSITLVTAFLCQSLWLSLAGAQSEMFPGDVPPWAEVNDQLIEQYDVAVRIRSDIPETGVISNVGAGRVTNLMALPAIELAPGATAKAYWGQGNLMSFVTLDPNAALPEGVVAGERFLFVLEGAVNELVNGRSVTLRAIPRDAPDGTHGASPKREFVYLQEGAKTSVKAGGQGARVLMVYAPVPSFYLRKAGSLVSSKPLDITQFPLEPTVEPNKIYDLYDFQFTELVPGADARLVSGHALQMSFLRMDPNTEFAYHNHPEEQVMIGLRGYIDEFILDRIERMFAGDTLNLPAYYVHGGRLGPFGCDALDVFFPPRTDYTEKMNAMLEKYHAIIPADAQVETVIAGGSSNPKLYFTEGPAWLDGKLYFSNMYFDAGWNGDPGKSSLVEMDPNGRYRNIIAGKMQTNGTIPSGDGNLIVCDMFGHRIIKVNKQGEVLAVLAESYDGKPLDGPNDLVRDAKGGIYFTDPQFTPDAVKNQPGRTVYYLNPEGGLIRLLEPNAFAMPNGVLLSPDGGTLYINNTYDDESWWNVDSDKDNFVWAYDVNADGTISNGRHFAELRLTGDVLDRKGRSAGADGMAIDREGNLYVATYAGVQIFSSSGEAIGMINTPTYPVSCTFGGSDLKTLYIASYGNIYRIRTNIGGL